MNDPTPQFTAGDVEVLKRETPFQGFFRLDRLHLRHRLFEGGPERESANFHEI